eukprot:CAMPEP_0197704102 /NCGR_PEP_ID=MMETSP1338-20131121/125771_1 /TAXON_ID=43686 ORGANISM="Pelagodinium beii, Strain RCC1491" /NCGR_SAMPLE_ID=MMETSP1338 /ASSEMBLY_ACC=CAM_ASM_000754 /LENGTH=235 /DNA_ID=CAMNT_0043288001 /DNA_START=403 /DNA_END=1110 /DNA_ORIENTATION=-
MALYLEDLNDHRLLEYALSAQLREKGPRGRGETETRAATRRVTEAGEGKAVPSWIPDALLAVQLGWIPDALPEIVRLGLLGRLEEVRRLLRSGDDVNAVDGIGMSALHHAAIGGHHEFASLLIEGGADLDLPAHKCQGDTALHLACLYGHASVASVLLNHGAADNPLNDHGLTPEHAAVANGHVECGSLLPRHSALKRLPFISWSTAEENLEPSRSTSASSWKSGHGNDLVPKGI